jgi:phosphate-selective porin OprO and OprP
MKKSLLTSLYILFISYLSFSQESNNDFKQNLKFGGRIMFDYDFNKLNNTKNAGSEFRRLRSFISGKVSENISFKIQLDYSKGSSVVNDAYIKFSELPKIGGSLTVGNFKEPTGLNILTSSKYITFIERATLVNYHQPRSTGMMYDTKVFNNRLSFQLAYNANSSSLNGLDKNINEGQNLNLRVTGLVFSNNETHQILHIGSSFSNRVPSKDDLGIRNYTIGIRPESNLASKVVAYTFTNINHINISNFELAYTTRAFSFQSEYTSAEINTVLENIKVPSYYAYVSYFLTGEHRPYKSSYKGFSRVKPLQNFDYNNGWGAFEIAVRVSSFDLSNVNQGELNDVTFGLNWYLNPKTRIMYNYVNAKNVDMNIKNRAHLIRFQVDF